MVTQNGITFPERVVLLMVLLQYFSSCCVKRFAHRKSRVYPPAAPGLGTTDAKVHCCS